MRPQNLSLTVLFLGSILALGACKSSGSSATGSSSSSAPSSAHTGHATISNEIVATAKVSAIDAATRTVTLKREDGTPLRIQCGTGVRNFDKIGVGDTVKVKYKETLSATRLAPGDPGTQAGIAAAAGRAEKGAQPAAGIGMAATVCCTIRSVDLEQQVVLFTLPSGEKVARHVTTPEGREFIKGLKAGDNVQLDYTEVIALTVDKVEG
jgi:hypothetical protein